MKKALLIATSALLLSLLFVSAAPAGNMLNPVLIPDQLSVGLGPEYDFTYRPLRLEDDGKIQFMANRILLDVTFNPTSFFGLRLKGGAGDMVFSDPKLDKISGLDYADLAKDNLDDYHTPFNFVGGGGLDFAFLKDPNKIVGLGMSVFGLYQMGSQDDIKVSLLEYGAALTFAVIRLGTVVPYAGFDYTGVSGSMKSTQGGQNDFTMDITNDLDSPVGVFAGLNVVLGDNLRFGLEGRFLNELSGGVNLMYQF
ncbi:MAG: hypothetical protein GX444_04800 [Myxococcales bacterium]|nr:hypothetical protein [Myxococcales bacterium]